MSLIKQRLAWEAKYLLGAEPTFVAFREYKENRLSEYFRLSGSMEEFFEYTISLERRLEEKQNDL